MTEKTDTRSDGTETQQESTEPTTFFTRRHLMKGAAGTIGVAALGGLGLWYGTQPSLAAGTFEESSDGTVTVTTNDGAVTDVSIAPGFSLDWANFGGGVSGFDFDITASVGEASATIYSQTGVSDANDDDVQSFSGDSLDDPNGTATITCARSSIVDGSNITTGDFPTDVSQGNSQSQTVQLSLTPSGTTNLGGSVSGSAATLSFDLVVENPDGTVTATITSTDAEASANNTVATNSSV